MDALSANEAKTHFGDTLWKAQHAPIQISKNGKPVAISAKEYECNQTLKLRYLQSRAAQAKTDIDASLIIDGDTFFNELDSGKYD